MTTILEPDHLKRMVKEYLEEDVFVFDVETRGEQRGLPLRNEVFWISFATHGRVDVLPLGHPIGELVPGKHDIEQRVGADGRTRNFKIPVYTAPPKQMELYQALDILEPLFFSDRLKANHNLKFDVESVAKYYDVDADEIPGPYFCTMVASHMLDENHLGRNDLGSNVKRRWDFVYDKSVGKSVETHPYRVAEEYGHMDGWWTWQLFRDARREIRRHGFEDLFELEMDVLKVLLHMETTGAFLDMDRATRVERELRAKKNELLGKMYNLAGREFNINSDPQLREILYGRGKGGFGLKPKILTKGGKDGTNRQPSTSKDALEFYQDHPFVETMLDHAEVDKMHGTYVLAWLGGDHTVQKGKHMVVESKLPLVHPDGAIHANFQQAGTVTGRFSCSEPNLQNIPRPETELGQQIRSLFVAPPDHTLIVADYAQIEYVVMAHFSKDPVLVKAFNTGVDLHRLVASMIYKIPEAEVSKPMRTVSKNTSFAVAYGAGDDKVAAMSHITVEEAIEFRRQHRRLLIRLYKWADGVPDQARRRKPAHIETLLGRKRRLPALHARDWAPRSYAERQAVNSLVQGSAADIIKLAMVRLYDKKHDSMRLSLSVHDELVMIVPDDRVEQGQEIMHEAMLGKGISSLLDVPMKIDMHAVKRWSEAKE